MFEEPANHCLYRVVLDSKTKLPSFLAASCFIIHSVSDSSSALKLDLCNQPIAVVLSPILSKQSWGDTFFSNMSIHILIKWIKNSNKLMWAQPLR